MNDLNNRLNSLNRYTPNSNTNTASSLTTARTDQFVSSRGDRSNVQNVAFLITDGTSNVNAGATQSEANTLKNAGAVVFGVGVGNAITESEVRGVSSNPQARNSNYWILNNYNDLTGYARTFASTVCSYTATPITLPGT